MRGKRAKHLRRVALKWCHQEKIRPGDGFNRYNQAMNRLDWEAMIDDAGKTMLDQDGEKLIKPVKAPGTIKTAWKWRIIYQELKKQTKGKRLF